MPLRSVITAYVPQSPSEAADRELMLRCLDCYDDLVTRDNPLCHFTASSWITDPASGRVLMVWHNIYRSWSWTGGHADGCADLRSVALREAGEETGASGLRTLSDRPFSLEILPVQAHVRRDTYVTAHLHLNLTYLLTANADAPLTACVDENSGVRWMTPGEIRAECAEPFMLSVYEKLNLRLNAFLNR